MTEPARPERDVDAGFSLVEVIVSMVLLALVAIAFLPLVARTAGAAATGSTIATANRMVSEQMELARASSACPTSVNPAAQVKDRRGAVLVARTDVVGECSSGLVRLTVQVARSTAPAKPLATATTLVSVGGP